MKEQLKDSEKQRHEAEEAADIAKGQVVTLEADIFRLQQDNEMKDKLLEGETEARKE